jgi:diguanylate cyclase
LRNRAVALTWDDMGSGASSLRHVTQIPVDGLKIDQIFINDLHTSASALAVVRMLIHLAAGLDLTVTAEGVETAEQLATLTRLGAGFAQGFHIARPAAHRQPAPRRPTPLTRRTTFTRRTCCCR